MSKKIFIISAVIFALVLIGLGVQYFWFGDSGEKPQAQTNEPTNQQTGVATQSTSVEKIKKLVEGKSLGVVFNADGSKLRYFQDSRFLEIDIDGTAKNPVGAYPFKDVANIDWASTKKHALVATKEGFYVYDLDSDQTNKLKDGIDVVAWSGQGDKIIYKFFDKDTGKRTLNIADPNGSNWRDIGPATFRYLDFKINPGSGEICYHPSPDSFTAGQFLGTSFSGQTQRKIFEGRFGADFLWSHDGKKLLISGVSEKGGRMIDLGVANDQGGEYRSLNFPSTVKKCVWSKDNVTVYCAMMVGIVEGNVLPNDWTAGKLSLADTFWKVDTQTGKKERLLEPLEITQSFDAENLLLDHEERYLFFMDRKNGEIYRLEL